MKNDSQADQSPRLLLFVFVSLVTVILVAGYYFYTVEEQNSRENEHNDIAAVAELKVGQIVRWRYEREGDALMIQNNRAIAQEINEFLRHTVPAADLTHWVESFRKHNGYLSVTLFDPEGRIHFSAGQGGDTIGVSGWNLLQHVFRNKKIFLSDLRFSEVTQTAVMDLFIPVFGANGNPNVLVGVLRLCVDPSQVLYPLVQSWPTPSKTGETLLLRREGDEIVFLNDLRHRKDSALKFRRPNAGDDFVAAMACRGIEGLVRGVDYRGVPVLADIRKVPGSTWIMVAKIDEAEVYEPLQRQTFFIISFVVLAIVAAGSITGWWWRNQRAAFYRRQYQAEIERRALATRFEYLLKHANDIILLTDSNGRIVEANDKAVSTYAYTGDELIGMNVDDMRGTGSSPDTAAMKMLSPERNGLVYETIHRKKDGTPFAVEVSLKAVDIEGVTYYQGILRDITERKGVESRNVSAGSDRMSWTLQQDDGRPRKRLMRFSVLDRGRNVS
jgi:two-component system cell cycle sensor histidine kinase/response regulator CckA